VLGVMGYLDISMNIATVMVASIALGVVDDDTIHFINRYRREIAAGASIDDAIQIATTHEGRASLTTAIINSAGYGVLLLSEYKPTAWFGGLLALTMAVAFLAEVFILPATIKLLPGIFGPGGLKRRRVGMQAALLVIAVCGFATPAKAQNRPTGYASALVDYFPNRDDSAEIRARIFAEEKFDPSSRLTITASGFAEGLVGRRLPDPASLAQDPDRSASAGIVRVQEATIHLRSKSADLVAGFGKAVWGRLDELQPTDVVNPLDASRFFFEGRSEARLPVTIVHGRVFLGDRATIEGVYVPLFRKGRFDQLDEVRAPFNISGELGSGIAVCLAIGCPTLPPVVVDDTPAASFANAQGGVRVGGTAGRLDWSVSAYRGFDAFGIVELAPSTPFSGGPVTLNRVYPRFTMIGGDFETVRGEWILRGEIATFIDDHFQTTDLRAVPGSSIDAGVGIDRKAGNYRLSGTLLVHQESLDAAALAPEETDRTDVSLLAALDRSFSRDRYNIRAFAVVTPSESSAFLRAIGTVSLRDNVAFESSAGWFPGSGRDIVGRFAECDFMYARLKYYF
jgi:MMPL family protein